MGGTDQDNTAKAISCELIVIPFVYHLVWLMGITERVDPIQKKN